jgi:integrase
MKPHFSPTMPFRCVRRSSLSAPRDPVGSLALAWKKRLVERAAEAGVIRFGAVIDRYIAEEIPSRFSTRHSYLSYINNHIRPRWGNVPVREVKPALVRTWLKGLPLAPRSKGHIRCLMHVLFDFSMLWEFVDVQRNPMELVRLEGSTKRTREPRVLTVEEFQNLLQHVDEEPFRTMLLTAMCLGLGCSELLGLKWSDFDWERLTILVQRAVVAGRVDNVKTKYSRALMPLDPALGEVLLSWKLRSPFSGPDDWVFASPYQAGEMPYRSWGIQQRTISPAAKAEEGRTLLGGDFPTDQEIEG